MTRLEILRDLCERKGISINKLEQELGFSQGSLGKIDSSVPKSDKLYAIAQYFDVPMELFFRADDPTILKSIEDQLDEALKKALQEPVYDVAGGQGRINDGYSGEYVTEEEEELDRFSWCRVCGDSMYPILQDGDYIKVEHMTQTEPTDLTVVKINGDEATVKYVSVVSDGIMLRAENKDVFEDTHYSVSDVLTMPITIVGKVVEMKRKF